MDSKSAVGQVVPYNPPAMQWINFFIDIITEEVELLMHPAGIILMVFIFCMIGKLFMSKAKFTREKDQQLTEIKKCNNIIATLRHENEIHVRMHATYHADHHACMRVYTRNVT